MKLDYFKHITSNSKKVIHNSIFVSTNNNQNNILEAINNGASLIVSSKKLNLNVKNLIVSNIEYFYCYWYKKINKIDVDKFVVIGVTGTDGKTTTSKMIYDTISERYKVIYIGTLGILCDRNYIKTNNTTPDLEIVLETFLYAKENNIKYIIIESSSEGLLAKRLTGIKFDRVIFTNLSHEHLNTHKTMESYFETKKIILSLLKENAVVISNREDNYGKLFKGNKTINYGLHKGKVRTLSIKFNQEYSQIFIVNNNHFYYYKIPFIGIYNIYNFLATHALISSLFNITNFNFNNLTPPSGRFLKIENNVIIDFAHTPNALENLLITINETYINKEIILVLGAQGEKDKSKRKLLGSVASKHATQIILTSEDPKNESLLDIIFDISIGITKDNYTIELSRKEAIKKGMKILNSNSILVIVGKGLEDIEKHNNKVYKHSDYDCVLSFINEKKGVSKTPYGYYAACAAGLAIGAATIAKWVHSVVDAYNGGKK